jgi:hypothetical protein
MVDVNGAWFARGDVTRQCAIFQAGGVLLLINDKGSLAKARFSDPKRPNVFTLDESPEWDTQAGGTEGVVSDDARRIDWPGGGCWMR